jgi:hypothetical protein
MVEIRREEEHHPSCWLNCFDIRLCGALEVVWWPTELDLASLSLSWLTNRIWDLHGRCQIKFPL